MQVIVHTDHNIESSERLNTHVEASVVAGLERFRQHLTRVEVHLADENAGKTGQNDKRCTMEARFEGHKPTVVTHHADTIDQAIDGATEKLERALDHALGRLRDR